ncbi:MAG: PilZ domain-containing protein [Pseudomonadota bacterium]
MHDDRRKFERFEILLAARLLLNGFTEHDGEIQNISEAGIAVSSSAAAQVGDGVIATIEGLDRIEGRVCRVFEGGFAISAKLPAARRSRLRRQIEFLMNPSLRDQSDERRGVPRHKTDNQHTICIMPDGHSRIARVVDLSARGIAVEIDQRPWLRQESPKPPPGSMVQVGRMTGRVVRHTLLGFAVEFTEKGEEIGDAGTAA